MQNRDYGPLIQKLSEEYERHSPRCAGLNARAHKVMVDGGSHGMRLIQPFPPRAASAKGAWVTDVDGHRILDFWQGHLGNILGHNPPVVTAELAQAFAGHFGLQTGFTDYLQIETAELLCRLTNSDRVRFTTSGTLATMYAIVGSEVDLARVRADQRRIILALDADAAGEKATLRGLEVAREAMDHSEELVFDARGLMRHEARLQDLKSGKQALPLGRQDENDGRAVAREGGEVQRTIVVTALQQRSHVAAPCV